MLYPESSDLIIRAGKGKTACLGVREECGVEVETASMSLCELYPSLEVTGLDAVTVDNLAILSDSVVSVNVDLVGSGNEGESLIKVCKNLVGVARATGVVTGSLNTAGESTCTLETSYVVCLPAVHADSNVGKLCDSRFGINTVFCVDFLSGLVSCVCHNDLLCIMYLKFFTILRCTPYTKLYYTPNFGIFQGL